MAIDPLIAHEKQAVMNYILKQAEPLKGNYAPIKDDYIQRLFENRVSQLEKSPLSLTADLYSKSSTINLPSSQSVTPLPDLSYLSLTPLPIYSSQPSTSYSWLNK